MEGEITGLWELEQHRQGIHSRRRDSHSQGMGVVLVRFVWPRGWHW